VSTSRRVLAFLAYLFSIVGAVIMLLLLRRDRYVAFHAKQAIALFALVAVTALGWALISWVSMWIPFLPVVTLSAFSLVIAALVFGVIATIMGMSNALRDRTAALPLVGGWAKRLPPRA
jgi:uncharacterized membrane protein